MSVTKKLIMDVARGSAPREDLISEIINTVPILDMAEAYADSLLTGYKENVKIRLRPDQYEALLTHFELIESYDNSEGPRAPGRPKKKKTSE